MEIIKQLIKTGIQSGKDVSQSIENISSSFEGHHEMVEFDLGEKHFKFSTNSFIAKTGHMFGYNKEADKIACFKILAENHK